MTYIKKFENDYISILENIKKIKEDSSINETDKKLLYSEELLKLGELRYKFKRLEKVFNDGKSENGEELSQNQIKQLGKFVSYFYIFNDKDSNINNILSTSEEYGIYRYSVLHREFVDLKYILYTSGSITEDELLEEVNKHKKQTLKMISTTFGFNKSIDLCEEELNDINYEKENKRTLKYAKLFATVALASVLAASTLSCHKDTAKDNNAIEKTIDDESNNKYNNDTKNETSTSNNQEEKTETKENKETKDSNDKTINSKENTENSNKSTISSNGKTSTNKTSTNDKSTTGSSSKTTTNGGGVDLDRDKTQNGDVTIVQGDGKTVAPDDSKVEGNDYEIVDDNFSSHEDKINDTVNQPDKQDTYSEDTNHKTTRPSTDKVDGSDEQKTNVKLNESADKVNDTVNQPDKKDTTVEQESNTTTPTIIEEDENDVEYFFVPNNNVTNNNVTNNNDIYIEDFEDYDTSGYEIEEDAAYTLTLTK